MREAERLEIASFVDSDVPESALSVCMNEFTNDPNATFFRLGIC